MQIPTVKSIAYAACKLAKREVWEKEGFYYFYAATRAHLSDHFYTWEFACGSYKRPK